MDVLSRETIPDGELRQTPIPCSRPAERYSILVSHERSSHMDLMRDEPAARAVCTSTWQLAS